MISLPLSLTAAFIMPSTWKRTGQRSTEPAPYSAIISDPAQCASVLHKTNGLDAASRLRPACMLGPTKSAAYVGMLQKTWPVALPQRNHLLEGISTALLKHRMTVP